LTALGSALGFGVAILFMVIGLIGVIVPVLPGTVLIWLVVVVYALFAGIESMGWGAFAILNLIGMVAGTADLWLPLLGAKTTGASKRSMFLGVIGMIIGTMIMPLVGTVVGYGLGILLGEYHKVRDVNKAIHVALGGMAGWGIATIIQFSGGVLMLIIFAYAVLTG